MALALVAAPVASYAQTRCKAITQEGTQCKRNAEANGKYCWQHAKMVAEGKKVDGSGKATAPTTKAKTTTTKTTSTASASTQCAAKTAAGERCKRKAQEGSKYCAQHAKSTGKATTTKATAAEKKETKTTANKAATTQCAAKTASGERCKRKAQEGSKYCAQHAKANTPVQCAAKTASGEQCKRKAQAGSQYCAQHAKKQ